MYAILKNMPQIPKKLWKSIFKDRFVLFTDLVHEEVNDVDYPRTVSGVPMVISDLYKEGDIFYGGDVDYKNGFVGVGSKIQFYYNNRGDSYTEDNKLSTVESVCKSLEEYLQSIGCIDYEIIRR